MLTMHNVTQVTPARDKHTQLHRSRVYTYSYQNDTGSILSGLWGLCL